MIKLNLNDEKDVTWVEAHDGNVEIGDLVFYNKLLSGAYLVLPSKYCAGTKAIRRILDCGILSETEHKFKDGLAGGGWYHYQGTTEVFVTITPRILK